MKSFIKNNFNILFALSGALGFAGGKIVVHGIIFSETITLRFATFLLGYCFFSCFVFFAVGKVFAAYEKSEKVWQTYMRLIIVIVIMNKIISNYSTFVLEFLYATGA